ncbi:serine hydrolase domain-containing protein [Streptomyces sp. HNM0574]|uniref:serine hydrolase domain-containing protein n=1 Tax=Streptomyces sp. HNM0574 TaxID=2714954 RepID=UPI00146E4BD4|nr:serine hydrolase domain-containing protein [Streptomyces sp. HNM0574]NLU67831.1 beta-lactamase family protein [Streptomyces sp. HNM0574]
MSMLAPAEATTDVARSLAEERLREAVESVDAPDVVFAHSQYGLRTVATGGTGPLPGVPREALRYELGSATKTFTGLLLAELARQQYVRLDEPAARRLLPPGPPAYRRGTGERHRDAITLLHLATHTSGLPRVPHDLIPQAVPKWRTNPYAAYGRRQLLDAFAGSRPRRAPGSHWWYSNFGVALLGIALSEAAGTHYPQLLHQRVLAPLGMDRTCLAPQEPGEDATGHGRDGVRELPPFDPGGFTASAGVRATPGDLLTYLEAHLRPGATPLPTALTYVRKPLLHTSAGAGRRHTYTLAWTRHPSPEGCVYFHSGATMGQEAFLGFRPDTGTAVVALATRRYARGRTVVRPAYRLLTEGI